MLLVSEGVAIGFVHGLHHLPHALLILKGREMTHRGPGPPRRQELTLGFTADYPEAQGHPNSTQSPDDASVPP